MQLETLLSERSQKQKATYSAYMKNSGQANIYSQKLEQYFPEANFGVLRGPGFLLSNEIDLGYILIVVYDFLLKPLNCTLLRSEFYNRSTQEAKTERLQTFKASL